MLLGRMVFAASAGALSLSLAVTAAAYCRTSVCKHGTCRDDSDCAQHETCVDGECAFEGTRCNPPTPSDCGTPLFWAQACIGFDLQEDASREVSFADADAAMRAAVSTWERAGCGGGKPSISAEDLGPVSCDRVEYNEHAGNANVVVFRDDDWPNDVGHTANAIALTTVTYDVETGAIYDADIEVNTALFDLSTMPAASELDLQAVLTHEAGHYFGLAHSPEPGATMSENYFEASELRTLSADDVAGICTIYPPGRQTEGECVPLPRHGFSPECAAAQTEGNCALLPGAGSAGAARGAFAAVLVVAALAAARRRR